MDEQPVLAEFRRVVDEAVGAVVVVSHLGSGRARAVDALQAADRRGVRVFYAGNAFTAPRSRRYLPGTYLGAGLQDACTLIEAGLTR